MSPALLRRPHRLGTLAAVVAACPPPPEPRRSSPHVTARALLAALSREATPNTARDPWLRDYRRRNHANVQRGLRKLAVAAEHDIPTMLGTLRLVHLSRAGAPRDYGLVSTRVVTTAGVGFMIDAWQNLVEMELMKFHGIGTGVTGEAVGDTGLVAELSTQYSTDSTRATGTLAEAAANIFRTVGTVTVDAGVAITEHGVFSQASAPGGVLLDRSVFAAVNLVSGDSLQLTYDYTLTAGS